MQAVKAKLFGTRTATSVTRDGTNVSTSQDAGAKGGAGPPGSAAEALLGNSARRRGAHRFFGTPKNDES